MATRSDAVDSQLLAIPTPKPSLMDGIPLEIAVIIMENLEEYDLAPTAYSEFTEQPRDKLVLLYGFLDEDLTWVMFTKNAYSDIINARLSCRKLYDASNKSFAKLLGDRRIRLTKSGLDDLVQISRKVELRPYIKTLTFGSARFYDDDLFVSDVSSGFSNLESNDSDRLHHNYMSAMKRQQHLYATRHNLLAVALQRLPQLQNLRVVIHDTPSYLAGWLQPGDEDLIHRDHYLFHDRTTAALYDPDPREIGIDTEPFYYSVGCEEMAAFLTEALKTIQVEIQDLRFSYSFGVVDYQLLDLPLHKLRVLRLPLSRGSLHWRSYRANVYRIVEIVGNAPQLEDLSFIWNFGFRGTGNYWEQDTGDEIPQELEVSRLVFQALRKHTRLRRFALTSALLFTATDVVAFVKQHAGNLECLILEQPLLAGDWRSVLRQIAEATCHTLKYFRLRYPAEIDDFERVYTIRDTELDAALTAFTCPVELVALSVDSDDRV